MHKGCINRTDGINNRYNTIPTIPDITIPKIQAINIPSHQWMDALTEGRIGRKGYTLSVQYGIIYRRGRKEGNTHQ